MVPAVLRLLCASLGLLAVVGTGCQLDPGESAAKPSEPAQPAAERRALRIGDPAPNFRLWDLAGDVVDLSSYRGSVVLLNFWATWCGPCRVEMPSMEVLYRYVNRKDFEILAVSTDAQGVAVTRPFRDSIGLSFPILHDSDYRVGVLYGARTLPMTFLIDRDGIIRYRIFGARDWQSPEAKALIQALLAKG